MGEDLVAWTQRFIEWTNAGIEQAEPLVKELLALPAGEWDAWLVSRPEGLSVFLFEELVAIAEEDGSRSLPLTEFVLRHVDSITVPPEHDLELVFLRGHARRVGALALLQQAVAIFRSVPYIREELELVEKAEAAARMPRYPNRT